eukprot:2347013-Pleurochrysis_carterae.AAC.1
MGVREHARRACSRASPIMLARAHFDCVGSVPPKSSKTRRDCVGDAFMAQRTVAYMSQHARPSAWSLVLPHKLGLRVCTCVGVPLRFGLKHSFRSI